MYLRFVIRRQHAYSRSDTGLFCVAGELQDSSELTDDQRELLDEVLHWFSDKVPVPSRLKESTSNRVICWFKPEAKEAIDRMWTLVSIIKDSGYPVELLKTDDPGVILEEDDFQVLAQPYRTNRKIPR